MWGAPPGISGDVDDTGGAMSDPVPLATVAQTLRWLSREMERDGSDLAHVPAQVAALLTRPVGGGCKSCGGPVELVPVGRPRLHCEACRRPRRQTPPKSHAGRDGRDDDDSEPA